MCMKKLMVITMLSCAAVSAFAKDYNFFRSDDIAAVSDAKVVVKDKRETVKGSFELTGSKAFLCKKDSSSPNQLTFVLSNESAVRSGAYVHGDLLRVYKDGKFEKVKFKESKETCNNLI